MIRQILTGKVSSDDVGDALVIGVCVVAVALFAFGAFA